MSILEASRKMTSREQTAYDLGFHEGQNAAIVHGRWEKAHISGYLKCNCCKDAFIYGEWLESGKWNYCPHCGADMRGEEDGSV